MNGATRLLVLMALPCALVWSAGCEDQKQQIALLEESNMQLLDDVQSARDELDTLRSDYAECQDQLALAQGEVGRLADQLSSRPVQQMITSAPAPSGWTSVPGGAMIAIEGSVLFDSGKVVLRNNAQRALDGIASALEGQYGAKEILVFGHTDDAPIKKSGWKDNYQLSTERALAVVRWLKSRGIEPRRLVACGCGEYRPRVPNASPDQRKLNRRVEIFAMDAELRTARR